MKNAFLYLVRKEFRDQCPTLFGVFNAALTVVITVLVYRFTALALAKGFQGSANGFGGNYFTFVLIGDIFLVAPLALFIGVGRAVREAAANGTMDLFLIEPTRVQNPFLMAGLALLPRECARSLATFLVAALLFPDFLSGLSFFRLFGAVSVLALAAPAFVGLGLVAAALLVRLGRGNSAIDHVSSLAAIFAGAYFPLDVLPAWLHTGLSLLSPFTITLQTVRAILTPASVTTLFPALAQIIFWDVVLFPIGYVALGLSFEYLRRKGSPLLIATA